MSPPFHVKIISGGASVTVLALGIRTVLKPGSSLFLPLLPFFGTTTADDAGTTDDKPEELVPGQQQALSKVSGWALITLAIVKLTTIFTHTNEGTFLRRNLFLALGTTQLVGSIAVTTIGDTQSKAKAAGASFWPFAVMLGGEGLVLLHDALMRNRPIKPH